MENYLIECTFDSAWVLRESKKNSLPVETLLSGMIEKAGEPAVRVLKKNYVTCRFVVTQSEGMAEELEAGIRDILRRNWEGGEAESACAVSVARLSQEEADGLFGDKEKAAFIEQQKKEARAAASTLPAEEKEEEAAAAPKEEAPAPEKKKPAAEKAGALDAIQRLVGAEEFKALAQELCTVAPRITQAKLQRTFSFQHYLFAISDGCGLTTALERLADLVEELGLLRFSGKRRIMEISLDPTGGDEEEALQKARDFLRSRNRFKGLICLDIGYWIPKVQEPKFQRMLRAIDEAEEGSLYVFRVPYMKAETLENLRQSLSDAVYTRLVTFPPFSAQEYREYTERQLASCRFVLEEEAWPVFETRLTEEKSNARFYGLDTADKLVNEMMYRKLLRNAETGEDSTHIAAADIGAMAAYPAAEDALKELDGMVGMESIRDRILEVVAQVQLQKEMAETGRFVERPCLHMRFVGSPGTGKTTVARLVGKILKEKGILEIGNFYEVSGRSLCGRYVGETAPKTTEICRRAYGSVLFIDESYSLYAGDDNSRDYGKEAIDTLIAEMENNRDKMVVIMSGYPDEMETLMRANPGLAGRMPYEIRFPNYTKDQLTRIFLGMAGAAFELDDSFREAAAAFFGSVSDSQYKAKNFGNARLARNLYERVWAKAAIRRQRNKDGDIRLLSEDLDNAIADKEFQRLLEDKKRPMGFTSLPHTK